jgi:fibronectin type 3 domain-containing protein
MHRRMISSFFVAAAMVGCAESPTASGPDDSTSPGETVSLAWDANSEGDLAGYHVYVRTAAESYTTPTASVVAPATTHSVADLASGTTYYFVVSAFDVDGYESGFSNEVSAIVP